MVAIVCCVMNKENIAFSFPEVFRGLNTNIIRLRKNKKSAITRARYGIRLDLVIFRTNRDMLLERRYKHNI